LKCCLYERWATVVRPPLHALSVDIRPPLLASSHCSAKAFFSHFFFVHDANSRNKGMLFFFPPLSPTLFGFRFSTLQIPSGCFEKESSVQSPLPLFDRADVAGCCSFPSRWEFDFFSYSCNITSGERLTFSSQVVHFRMISLQNR